MIARLSVASGASAQEKLKFAVFTPEAEMTHQIVMKPWAERVNKESDGTLDIQTFPNGALGRNPGLQTKMLQDGVADIAWVIPSYTPGVYLDDDVFELPNIIQDSVEGSLGRLASAAEGHAARLRPVLHDRAVHLLALHVPHQLPGAKGRRPQGQEDPRRRHDLDRIGQGAWRRSRGHAVSASFRKRSRAA